MARVGVPHLLCFDPTRGIDVGTKRQLYALLRSSGGRRRRDPVLLQRAGRVPARLRPRVTLFGGGSPRSPGRGADEAALLRAMHGLVEERAPRHERPAVTASRRAGSHWPPLAPPARLDGGRLRAAVRARPVLALQHRPPWGPFDVQSLAIDALPLAFAACGQAIAIISGGIDLSIGSLMSLVNVVSARWMVTMSLREAVFFMLLIVLGGALAGVLTGTLIVVTRVADIIVTLSMLFVWAGAALAVMTIPGGGVPPRLGTLVTVDTVLTTGSQRRS